MRSVRLDDELEKRLAEAAKLTNTPISEIIREALRKRCDELLGQTLYDQLADVIGCIDSGGKYNSRRTGKAFTEVLMKKRARRK
ncbi:MAG: CopG family transcriptional regulator [Planctomycetes bacterium]|nr:CopG family transcriptional regulator [Planctomycetota bacterium]